MPAIWIADGSKAGPTNNPLLEWMGYSGAGNMAGGKHDKINLVTAMGDGTPPMSGSYLYRHELAWSGKPDGLASAFGDRLELLNAKPGGEGAVPAGMPLKARQWKEGDEVWAALAFYFPELPHHEVHWSEDPLGCLPVCQFHGAVSETNLAVAPVAFIKIRLTQEVNEFNGKPYEPHVYIKLGASGEGIEVPAAALKAKTWYRVIFRFVMKAAGGTMSAWLAEGQAAPFVKVATMTGKTTIGSFVFPCQGGPRNEETEPAVTAHNDVGLRPPTEVVYYDKMVFLEPASSEAATLAEAEAVLQAGAGSGGVTAQGVTAFKLTASPTFPAGTVLRVFERSAFPGGAPRTGVAPGVAPVGEATVEPHGFALIEGLAPETQYIAGAEVAGVWRYISFRTSAVPVSSPSTTVYATQAFAQLAASEAVARAESAAGTTVRAYATNNLTGGPSAMEGAAGEGNTAFGTLALSNLSSGEVNTALGRSAGRFSTTAVGNTLVGVNAGTLLTTGSQNAVLGATALQSATTEGGNTAVGYGALTAATAGSTVGVGAFALHALTTGVKNTAVGFRALTSNVTGERNTAVGWEALSLATGSGSTAVGSAALLSLTTGSKNTAVGAKAMVEGTTAKDNVAVGYEAGIVMTTAAQNTLVGSGAGVDLTSGENNTAVGYLALQSCLVGRENVAVGNKAGGKTTGSGNVFLGAFAGEQELGSNKLYVANSNTTTPLILGDFSTGALTLTAAGGKVGFYGTAPVGQAATFAALGEAGASTVKQIEEQLNKLRAVVRGLGLMA